MALQLGRYSCARSRPGLVNQVQRKLGVLPPLLCGMAGPLDVERRQRKKQTRCYIGIGLEAGRSGNINVGRFSGCQAAFLSIRRR